MRKLVKEGYNYNDIKDKIQPLDLILFRGSDFVSDTIRLLEYTALNNNWADDYSHCGIIITRDLLDDPRLEEGKLYIWESTMSGKLGQNVYNIDGKTFLGVQVRKFDDLIVAYDQPRASAISWCRLQNNPLLDINKKEQIKQKFLTCFQEYNGRRYNINLYGLLSTLYKHMRFLRKPIAKILHTNNWIFCSELLALAYKSIGVLDESVNEKDVLPVDFITSVDADKAIPDHFVSYPIHITIDEHYDERTVEDYIKI